MMITGRRTRKRRVTRNRILSEDTGQERYDGRSNRSRGGRGFPEIDWIKG